MFSYHTVEVNSCELVLLELENAECSSCKVMIRPYVADGEDSHLQYLVEKAWDSKRA